MNWHTWSLYWENTIRQYGCGRASEIRAQRPLPPPPAFPQITAEAAPAQRGMGRRMKNAEAIIDYCVEVMKRLKI